MKFSRIICLLIALACVIPALGQTTSKVEVDYNNPKKYIVGGVEVEGNEHFAPQQILSITGLQKGMEVTVPIFAKDVKGGINAVKEIYASQYSGKIVHFNPSADEGGFLSASAFSGRDDMEISVFGNDDRILLVSRFDNLGKGASGAAIQNMNIMLGVEETTGLELGR